MDFEILCFCKKNIVLIVLDCKWYFVWNFKFLNLMIDYVFYLEWVIVYWRFFGDNINVYLCYKMVYLLYF